MSITEIQRAIQRIEIEILRKDAELTELRAQQKKLEADWMEVKASSTPE